MSERLVVDSSGWIEFFTDGPNADPFAEAIEQPERLVVPTISLFEVFKWILREHGEGPALQAIALMQGAEVVGLSPEIALHGAQLSLELKLPMADSLMLATAQAFGALLITQDSDFQGLAGVRWLPKVAG
ncbi:type II toxin-antitoxin system VapC family toxin [Synechococcus sp. CS-602]|uniref:type II toxin-antitoxin system VapC family toxin n=1 Tax=Synechococcaceae TaxID=1890426 RepID=UPI000AD8C563|nr:MULTISPECIES: type II toxin-antitoxin system VapC family toxin [Synechococcaceae]MCT4365829.1 type II toxin-antitoxin system VapC family toxin [Candidatus Regnicoccus frigidus MAG-AL1]MCT0203294.1 type II toxin-antitoxin system VapC family toxin [Synechococcus sp. CS-603]MCT0203942.1 type II toxin-antitoxin system VapC family toxin [Synechococcus sp. CS-602]MCT0246514.1 type II toxin-antitoxin system VapC family toxin [Synechococcus sp. CS-601]MCT4366710.1 type II toxin-antitoxin system Vap